MINGAKGSMGMAESEPKINSNYHLQLTNLQNVAQSVLASTLHPRILMLQPPLLTVHRKQVLAPRKSGSRIEQSQEPPAFRGSGATYS
jgi:hypothetical protein